MSHSGISSPDELLLSDVVLWIYITVQQRC